MEKQQQQRQNETRSEQQQQQTPTKEDKRKDKKAKPGKLFRKKPLKSVGSFVNRIFKSLGTSLGHFADSQQRDAAEDDDGGFRNSGAACALLTLGAHSDAQVPLWGARDATPSTSSSLCAGRDKLVGQFGEKTPGVLGLKNHGNTCFMNAVVQCLSNTDLLAEYLGLERYRTDLSWPGDGPEERDRRERRDRRQRVQGEVTEQLATLVRALWTLEYTPQLSVDFKTIVSKYGAQFRGNAQHDALEFLLWLLDRVHEDVTLSCNNNNHQLPAPAQIADGDEELPDHCPQTPKIQHSFVQEHFQAQYKSSLTCPHCLKQSNTFDPFLCISLPIPLRQTRFLCVVLVFSSKGQRYLRTGLAVPLFGSVACLRRLAADEGNLSPDQVILTEVYSSGFQRSFFDEDDLSSIAENDVIYAFQAPPLYIRGGSTRVSGYHHSLPSSPYCSGLEGRTFAASAAQSTELLPQVAPLKILLLVCNAAGAGQQVVRFGPPFLMREDRAISWDQLQQSVLSKLYYLMINGAQAQNARVLFNIRVVGGSAFYSYLCPQDVRPLFHPAVERALKMCGSGGPPHVKLIVEWEPRVKDCLFGNIQAEVVKEVDSVRSQQQQVQTHSCTLDQCFQLYTKEEQLAPDDAWKCPHCQQLQQGTVKMSLWTLPDFLILHLKRFRQVGDKRNKLTTLVHFPLAGLDMTPHVVPLQNLNQVPLQNPSQVPNQVPLQNLNQVPMQNPNQVQTQHPNNQIPTQQVQTLQHPSQVPLQNLNQVPLQNLNQVPLQRPSQVQAQHPSQVPTQNLSQVPKQNPSQVQTQQHPKQIQTQHPSQVPLQNLSQVQTQQHQGQVQTQNLNQVPKQNPNQVPMQNLNQVQTQQIQTLQHPSQVQAQHPNQVQTQQHLSQVPTQHPGQVQMQNLNQVPTQQIQTQQHPSQVPTQNLNQIQTQHPNQVPTQHPNNQIQTQHLNNQIQTQHLNNQIQAQHPNQIQTQHPNSQIQTQHPNNQIQTQNLNQIQAQHPNQIQTQNLNQIQTQHPNNQIQTQHPNQIQAQHLNNQIQTQHSCHLSTQNSIPKPAEHPSQLSLQKPASHSSQLPSEHPSQLPSKNPSPYSTQHPSQSPSQHPSPRLSQHPSKNPSPRPSPYSTQHPSQSPSQHPSPRLSQNPSPRLSQHPPPQHPQSPRPAPHSSSHSSSLLGQQQLPVSSPAWRQQGARRTAAAASPDFLYDLYAVCNHHGGMHGGHYTAFCRNSVDAQWYSFDDSSVECVPEGEVCTRGAYILFYQRRNAIPPWSASSSLTGSTSSSASDHWLVRLTGGSSERDSVGSGGALSGPLSGTPAPESPELPVFGDEPHRTEDTNGFDVKPFVRGTQGRSVSLRSPTKSKDPLSRVLPLRWSLVSRDRGRSRPQTPPPQPGELVEYLESGRRPRCSQEPIVSLVATPPLRTAHGRMLEAGLNSPNGSIVSAGTDSPRIPEGQRRACIENMLRSSRRFDQGRTFLDFQLPRGVMFESALSQSAPASRDSTLRRSRAQNGGSRAHKDLLHMVLDPEDRSGFSVHNRNSHENLLSFLKPGCIKKDMPPSPFRSHDRRLNGKPASADLSKLSYSNGTIYADERKPNGVANGKLANRRTALAEEADLARAHSSSNLPLAFGRCASLQRNGDFGASAGLRAPLADKPGYGTLQWTRYGSTSLVPT